MAMSLGASGSVDVVAGVTGGKGQALLTVWSLDPMIVDYGSLEAAWADDQSSVPIKPTKI